MIRRTLALVGAATLAAGVVGLTGPAAADPGISAVPDVHLGQIGAELQNAGPTNDIVGGYIQLSNTGSNFNLNGFSVRACDVNGDLTDVVTFGPNDEISAGSTLLIAGPEFADPDNPVPNKEFDAGMNALQQEVGGVILLNGASEVDSVSWGMSNNTDCANFVPAGSTPNDLEALQRVVSSDTWELDVPNPQTGS